MKILYCKVFHFHVDILSLFISIDVCLFFCVTLAFLSLPYMVFLHCQVILVVVDPSSKGKQ